MKIGIIDHADRPLEVVFLGGFVRNAITVREGVKMSEDLKDEVERLRAETERLKNQRAGGISFKVSEKGAVSVYGLGRFPVTLYKEQWARVLASVDDLRAFIKENDARLKTKPDPKEKEER